MTRFLLVALSLLLLCAPAGAHEEVDQELLNKLRHEDTELYEIYDERFSREKTAETDRFIEEKVRPWLDNASKYRGGFHYDGSIPYLLRAIIEIELEKMRRESK